MTDTKKWTQTISHLLLTRISTPCSCNLTRLSQLWLQDGDPSQNRKAAWEAMGRCHSELLQIPP